MCLCSCCLNTTLVVMCLCSCLFKLIQSFVSFTIILYWGKVLCMNVLLFIGIMCVGGLLHWNYDFAHSKILCISVLLFIGTTIFYCSKVLFLSLVFIGTMIFYCSKVLFLSLVFIGTMFCYCSKELCLSAVFIGILHLPCSFFNLYLLACQLVHFYSRMFCLFR